MKIRRLITILANGPGLSLFTVAAGGSGLS